MTDAPLNHAHGLIASLGRKAMLLRQQAEDLDASKDGRSRMAVSMRQQADDLELRAQELAGWVYVATSRR
jgi:hypothetical protein